MAPNFSRTLNKILSATVREHNFKVATLSQDPKNPTEFICTMKSGKVYRGMMWDVQYQFKQDLIDSIFYYYQVARICQEVPEEPRLHNRLSAFSRFLSRYTNFDHYLYDIFSQWRKILYIASLRKFKIRWEEI